MLVFLGDISQKYLKFDKFFIYSQPKDIFTASFELFGRIVFHMATPNPNTQLRMLRGIHSSDCKHTKIFWIPYIIFPFMYKKQRLLKKTREVKKLNNVFQIFTTFYVSKHEQNLTNQKYEEKPTKLTNLYFRKCSHSIFN